MSSRFRLAPFLLVLAGIAIVFGFAARTYSQLYGLGVFSILGIYSCCVLLTAFALAPAFIDMPVNPNSLLRKLFVVLCCAPYLIYAAATADFYWLALTKVVALPALLLVFYCVSPVRSQEAFCLQDLLAAFLLICAVISGVLKHIWNVPVSLDFMTRLYLIALAAWTWTFVRPVPQLGYRLCLSRRILRQAALNFVLFAMIAIPLSLALHFTRWHPQWRGAGRFALNFLEIFLFIALLEELFFRGFLQSLLSSTWRTGQWAQFVVAIVFGLFHIQHAPFPNWRYVALASIAGWFYGEAFRKTGNITACALVHAAVDTSWRTFLSAR